MLCVVYERTHVLLPVHHPLALRTSVADHGRLLSVGPV
jgi:hypothetical protein